MNFQLHPTLKKSLFAQNPSKAERACFNIADIGMRPLGQYQSLGIVLAANGLPHSAFLRAKRSSSRSCTEILLSVKLKTNQLCQTVFARASSSVGWNSAGSRRQQIKQRKGDEGQQNTHLQMRCKMEGQEHECHPVVIFFDRLLPRHLRRYLI